MEAMRPVLIGVAGGSGSGKTALAEAAAVLLGATVIELDWYYHDLGALSAEERAGVNFDHPGSIDWTLCLGQLDALLAGRPIERPAYDFAAHTRRAETVRVEPAAILLIEGILTLHHEDLRARQGLRVFVELDESERFARRMRRDVCERGRSAESVRTQLEATVRPMHALFVEPSRRHADVIVDGGGDLEAEAERVSRAGRELADTMETT